MVSWFKKAFHNENSIKGATVILVVTLILSNLLGMIRDHFLAGKVSTYYLDVYYAAFKIPDLVFNLLILGAVSSVFIPIFTEKLSQGDKKRAFEIANRLLTATLAFTAASAVVLYFLMPYLIPLLVPKFNADRMQLTISVARVLMLTPLFFSMSYAVSGVLNSYKRFFAYSLAPLFYNLAIIFGALFVAGRFGIIGVAWTVVLGAALHFLIQLPSATNVGFKFKLSAFWHDSDIKRIFYLMIPRSIGLGTNQVTLLAFTSIASALAAGSIAVYTFADNIQTMPVVVFGTSLATVLFPTLSEKAAIEDKAQFLSYFMRALKSIILVLLPTALLLYLLANQLVRLILGSGKFNLFDTMRAADTLAAFSLAILFESILSLLVRSFFAQKNTRLPMYASFGAMILSIGLGYLFSRHFGVAGLALGIAFGNLFSVIYLFYYFDKRFIRIDFRELSSYTFKVIIATLISGAVTYSLIRIGAVVFNLRHFTGVLMQALIAGGAGIVTFILVVHWFKIEELKLVSKYLFARYMKIAVTSEKNIERL
jgi:putative peptidoglycan lipid II flippase